LTPRALRHLGEIERHIASDRPLAAMKVGERLREAIDFLREFPSVGHQGRRKNTLEWVVPGLPYIVVYRRRATILEVLGVYHGAQKYRA
jgi:plasmid stabilization system protein ParE